MAYTSVPNVSDEDRKVILAIEIIKDYLKLANVGIIQGGPSISDPLGLIVKYVSFKDKRNNGFWFGISEDGQILKSGARINEKEVQFPEIAKL